MNIFIVFQSICFYTAATCGILVLKRNKTLGNLNLLFLYIIIATLTNMFGILTVFDIVNPNKHVMFNNFSLLLHYSLLSYFIISNASTENRKKTIWYLYGFGFLPLIIFLTTISIKETNSLAFASSNLFLVIFCIYYYFQLFESKLIIDLKRHPTFWAVTGIFFGMCITVPFLVLRQVYKFTLSENLFIVYNGLISFAYGTMHLFFSKAILCLIPTKKA